MRVEFHKLVLAAACMLTAAEALADGTMVLVRQYVDGLLLREDRVNAGERWTTASAPVRDGKVFAGWLISTDQQFANRDAFGRAQDCVEFIPYEETDVYATYLAADVDEDDDGIADGLELHWQGTLDLDAQSDMDGDGCGFADELSRGTNPHFPDSQRSGRIRLALGSLVQLNPCRMKGYVINSDDDVLLTVTTNFVPVGVNVTTPSFSPMTSDFVFWTVNGEPLRDAFGRAYDSVSVPMPDGEDLVLTAVTEQDRERRLKLYWYGTEEIDWESDTDGDGLTFAEEVEKGTNPHFPDAQHLGRVKMALGLETLLNPHGVAAYRISADDGTLIPDSRQITLPGGVVTTPSLSPGNSVFAYWTLDGVAQRDVFGRALDFVSVPMPEGELTLMAVTQTNEVERMKLYWYGTTAVALDSDTDGDGLTFAQELARGTNPHFPDTRQEGRVNMAVGTETGMNAQGYEQVPGVLVDDEYTRLFDSEANAETGSDTFVDENNSAVGIRPIVVDLNDDGLFDIVVECVEGGDKLVFLNVGSLGNPSFREVPWQNAWMSMVESARPRPLTGLKYNVLPPEDALSWSFFCDTLLVSDGQGRIWCYLSGVADEGSTDVEYVLKHKVWGGSYAGFAQGLRIAAVDWDDDGDLDCLAGTAEGKLMLLRDPKVGRPTNLRAEVGVDSVKLDWDPNQQSRIRGYRVYRREGIGDQGLGIGEDGWSLLSLSSLSSFGLSTTLPTYRDYPPSVSDFDYKVSSVSRHYVAGNSTPIESESPATEAVRASLGKVRFFWNDTVAKQGERAEVLLSIENSLNYDVAGKTQVVTYDPAYLTPLKIVKTGLTENVSYEESVADGKWTITLKSGKLAAGGGKFFTLVFDALKPGTTKVGEATVTIVARQESAPYRLGDVTGDGVVDTLDLRELAKLKSAAGRKWTANQLKAGDFNGNGLLDNADYQALRDLLKEKGLL